MTDGLDRFAAYVELTDVGDAEPSRVRHGDVVEAGERAGAVGCERIVPHDAGGDGVGRLESGLTVFVPFTAPGDRVRVAESGIKGRDDVVRLQAAGYDAFLIGETLVRAEDPEETLLGLRGAERESGP